MVKTNMRRITLMRRATAALLLSAAVFMSGIGMVDAAMPPGPNETPFRGEPASAPEAPTVEIARVIGTNNARLSWYHMLEADSYEVWRGTAPFFDPPGEGNQIKDIPKGGAGDGTPFEYIDDGVDRYYGEGDPQLPAVQVIGDTATNYFWVVRSRNAGGEVSGPSNRVGVYTFMLAKDG